MFDTFAKVGEFNRTIIGIEQPDRPTMLTPERVDYTKTHLVEEAVELGEAETLADQVDALIDGIYVGMGRLWEMGLDSRAFHAHFHEVHEANMRRVRGTKSTRPNSMGYDAIKPDGWVGPDHDRVQADLDYTPPFRFPSFMHLGVDAGNGVEPIRRPKVILLGHAHHGKDTVAEMLRDGHGYSFQSSSMFCAERVMMPYFASHGVPYASVEECYADRVNHRATWFDKISEYNFADPARLCRELFAINDIYVGMRSAREFEAARELADCVVWIEDPRKPKEGRDSFDIDFHPSMRYLRNDGTLDDLRAAVDRLAVIIEETSK